MSQPVCAPVTRKQMWQRAGILAGVFALLNVPAAYKATTGLTNAVAGATHTQSMAGRTYIAVVLHAVVFGLIVYALQSPTRPVIECKSPPHA